jgi:hypothetical protein
MAIYLLSAIGAAEFPLASQHVKAIRAKADERHYGK